MTEIIPSDTLITDGLINVKDHNILGGQHLLYRWGNWGLSLINSDIAHASRYSWEAAVIKFSNDNSLEYEIVYNTPLTGDVLVFNTIYDTNVFILEAKDYFVSKEFFQNGNTLLAQG